MYKLTENFCWYGARRVPFTLIASITGTDEAIGIPLEIESAADLDLAAIAEELNRTVFDRTSRRNSRSRTARRRMAAEAWKLEVKETTPERADELNAKLAADGLDQYGLFKAQIYIAGNGVSLRYELQTCDSCRLPLQDNYHSDGVCGDCHDAALAIFSND